MAQVNSITFAGGAKSVTGSNYLLNINGLKIVIDCGLFQGFSFAEKFNYEKFPYNPAEVGFVFITHGHADHSGRLPKLFKEGFRGKVIASEPTIALLKDTLFDNFSLIADEARRDQHPPMFSEDDINGVFTLTEGHPYEKEINLGNGVTVVLHDAGHILGSSIIEFRYDGQKIYFTGDLGNPPMPLLNPPTFVHDADYVVIESAYGNRIHEDIGQRRDILLNTIKDTVARGGTLMIPSFAMERTQEIIYELNEMEKNKEISCEVPVFVDSPLATKLTAAYKRFPDYFNDHTRKIINNGDDIFAFSCLRYVSSVEESKKINDIKVPKIIIAGSGMSSGGRILHHQMRYLPDPNSTILFVGYQVEGSLGRKILDGAKEVHIYGNRIPVRCKVVAIGGYSAHADQRLLLKWLKESSRGGKLKKVFVVQGEENSALALAQLAEDSIGADCIVPSAGEVFEI